MRPLCYLNREKGNAEMLMRAFAAGSGAEITTRLEFVPGRQAVFWGVDRETLPIWREVVRTATPYVYVDNGYFRSKWSGGDYYRVTLNAEQCSGDGRGDAMRWRGLDLEFSPWRRFGTHVLIACQSDFWHERHGDGSAAEYAGKVESALRAFTRRPIIVRGKPIAGHVEPPLRDHLADCWAVVTHSSMVGVEALLSGVPVFVTSKCALSPMSGGELSDIEAPRRADREPWAAVLAANQWRLAEIRSGEAWRKVTA